MRGNVFILTEGACHKTGAGLPGGEWCPAPLGLPATYSGPSRSKRAWLPAGPLGPCPDHLGWGSGSRADPAEGNLGGGQSSCRGPWGGATSPAAAPLRSRTRDGSSLGTDPGTRPARRGLPSGGVDSPVTPRASQRCMWPLGSPEGSGRVLGLRARWPARPPEVRLVLGFTGFPALPASTAAPVRHLGSALPGPNPRKARMSWGLPSRPHSWSLPLPCCSRATSGSGSPASVPGSPWSPSWAGQAGPAASCAMGSSGPGAESCSWAGGAAGPGGLGTLGSKTSWSLGSRAPGAPRRNPDGCFAKAWTFLRVRGPPAKASAMA